MSWIIRINGEELPPRELVGGKAWSIARISSFGLPIPSAFVVTTDAHKEYERTGNFPAGLEDELQASIEWLEEQTERHFGSDKKPLLVSVRSGAAISMPGMMDTVLNLGMNEKAEVALAEEIGDRVFAADTHKRFLELYGAIVMKASVNEVAKDVSPDELRRHIGKQTGAEVPECPYEQLSSAVTAVFDSWNSRRAKRYRAHQNISDHLGTAVTVQAMVFGNLSQNSGTGVLFSRNPSTGERTPFGEFLLNAQGEDVVSGSHTPEPLFKMCDYVPDAYEQLISAAGILEEAEKDVQDIEFTVEDGKLFLLQARNAKLAPLAAVRTAVEFVTDKVISEADAISRLEPSQIELIMAPKPTDDALLTAKQLLAGEGACPGAGGGLVVMDSDAAEESAKAGTPVILARPTTSPHDLHGMIAAQAVITEQGGSTSHAAVVCRALGIPCVVGCGSETLKALVGREVTVDGSSGKIYDGLLRLCENDEGSNKNLALLKQWAAKISPIDVVSLDHLSADEVTDLSKYDGAEDPEKIGAMIEMLGSVKAVKGGAVTSPQGIRAVLEAGIKCIGAKPVLPTLLLAAKIQLNSR
ncbi:pyruvate, phosphate dikinase [Hyphococcus sp.]|uniref:pyruvate, phosphate dikinase n=1 Tax=Hyphococcus sp. TaxID=2038636 RepID=UPI003CCBAC45